MAIFPVAVIEGPIISIISGFLVLRHRLSFIPTFAILFFADFLSDSVFFLVGQKGLSFARKIKILHITDERVAKIERQYVESPWKTMIVAKVSYGLGTVFMFASGASGMSYKNFLKYMSPLNALRSLTLMGIGYYFGRVALRTGPKYIWYYTVAIVILVPLIYLVTRYIRKRNAVV